MGLEPTTFSLEGCERRTESSESQELMSAPANVCTNVCTGGQREGDPRAADTPDGDLVGEQFAEAVAMLDRLSLSGPKWYGGCWLARARSIPKRWRGPFG